MPIGLPYRGRKATVRRMPKFTRYRRRVRNANYRKKGNARPVKSLSLGYRGVPNQYRFIRETRPTQIDLGVVGNGVTHIAGTGSNPSISCLAFPALAINQVPGFSDFSNLFANYKVDKIETILVPMWSQQIANAVTPLTGTWLGSGAIPNLMITRINTKFLISGLTLKGTAEAQRDELAQIMKKKRSLYGSKKWLKVNTARPRVTFKVEDGGGGTNLMSMPTQWMETQNSADQEYNFNDLIFADRLDGTDFVPGLYLYRMYHRIHFRTAFVG